ncbi:hypothetical protein SAMN04487895_101725 [Paenibacillus sophorae]|uniref:Uncharacterized protein n=1 Tax=Paenibacillus sophorae TaxID=1333845 RepID=A0A1H8H3N4_9BACL|nr:hypothetical protein [Paenibacillus sophorae]QWU14414.1 hypothetical protein KP014_21130 [Paenibacillus sophorae]SEN50088.1 hypothetical protein SAMN04487895_101725 [Paenibacillus sophorae]
MKKRLNSAEAIAYILGWDIDDVKDNRYHYGHTSIPVFTAGDYYYCATTEGKEPAKMKGENWWKWERCESVFPLEEYGWVVWRSNMNE